MRTVLLSMGCMLVAAVAACGDATPANTDHGGGGGGGGSGSGSGDSGDPFACDVPDTSCPDDQPFPGGLCGGDLTCSYAGGNWKFRCLNDHWDGGMDCSMSGDECFPPLAAEGCEGASTKLDGENIPNCVMVKTTVSADVAPSLSRTLPTTLRCGETLRMYVVIPDGNCTNGEPDDTELVDTELNIDVEGIGSTSVMLKIPPDAFCSFLG